MQIVGCIIAVHLDKPQDMNFEGPLEPLVRTEDPSPNFILFVTLEFLDLIHHLVVLVINNVLLVKAFIIFVFQGVVRLNEASVQLNHQSISRGELLLVLGLQNLRANLVKLQLRHVVAPSVGKRSSNSESFVARLVDPIDKACLLIVEEKVILLPLGVVKLS